MGSIEAVPFQQFPELADVVRTEYFLSALGNYFGVFLEPFTANDFFRWDKLKARLGRNADPVLRMAGIEQGSPEIAGCVLDRVWPLSYVLHFQLHRRVPCFQ